MRRMPWFVAPISTALMVSAGLTALPLVSAAAVSPGAGDVGVGVARLVPPASARLGVATKASSKPTRVRELKERRTAFSTSYLRSDGSVEFVASGSAVHFRDGKGRWQDITTDVQSGKGDVAFANSTNLLATEFGSSTSMLVSVRAGGASLSMAAAGGARAVKPTGSGSSVTYADVFGASDVRYTVLPGGVKE